MAEIDTLNIGGIDYTIKDSVARSSGVANLIAYTENEATASQSYAIKGTPINWKGTLYYTTAAVAKGDTWAVNTNLKFANNLGKLVRYINVYVGSDGKLHFTDLTGADTVLNFSAKGYEYLGTDTSYDLSNRSDYKNLTNDNFKIFITGIWESAHVENWSAEDMRGSVSGSISRPQVSYNANTGALTITNTSVNGATGRNLINNTISYSIEVYLLN